MKSSGFKRGLAFSAVSALAITGIASTASADTVNTQVGNGAIDLLTQENGQASVKNDGTDSTIRLEAAAGANISSVTFQYQLPGGQPQNIATVSSRNDDGAFSFEWTPEAALIGATVNIIATATPSGGAAVSESNSATINAAGAGTDSVNLTTDGQQGVFQQPYVLDGAEAKNVIYAGTASDDDSAVTVDAPLDPTIASSTATPEDGDFTGVIDITGYTFSSFGTANSNQLPLRAVDGSDDVESYTLYNQALGTVDAEITSDDVPAGQPSEVTVTVTDTQGAPIAGAQVIPSGGTIADAQYTDENGETVFAQADGTTAFYYANATDANEFAAGQGDKRSDDIVIGDDVAVPTTIEAESDTGFDSFDVDETGADNVTITVRDQNGRRVAAGTPVDYRVEFTPFDADSADDTIEFPDASGVTDANGEVDVPLPLQNEGGTYEVFASIPADPGTGTGEVPESSVLTVKAGEAEVVFTPGDTSAPAGGEVDFTGSLELEDGTGLEDRDVDLTIDNGNGGSDTTPDTVIDPTGEVTTDANGEFDVTVDDVNADGSEIDVVLTGIPQDNAGDAGSVEVDFATDGNLPAGTTIEVRDTGTFRPGDIGYTVVTVTAPDDTIDRDAATPGVQGDVDADRDAIVGQQVTLRTSNGYFVDSDSQGNPIPSPAPVVGAPAGSYQGDNTTVVTTGSTGTAYADIAIGRDQGFDDDGEVTATVTATSGGVTGTGETDFDSSNALNPGELTFSLSDDSEQEGPVDPAPIYSGNDTRVYYDLQATDQFGNRTTVDYYDLDLDVDSNNADGYILGGADFDDTNDSDFYIESDTAGDVDFTVTWFADTFEYTTTTGDGNPTAGSEDVVAEGTTTFYDFDFGDGEATIVSSPEGEVAPGTAVTETLTVVDNNDQPVENVDVIFTVTAPDGTVQEFQRETNENGQASIVVVATQEGTYQVTATASDGTDTLTATDTISVTETPVVNPTATLQGKNTGPRADRLKVKTVNVEPGTNVRLFRFGQNGARQLVDAGSTNDNGAIRFTIRDRNGKKVTKYIARVGGGDEAFFTNAKRVR